MGDTKMPERSRNWWNMTRYFDEPTSFLYHVFLGFTHVQRECKPNEIIINGYREMFESRICVGVAEKFQDGINFGLWSYDKEGRAQKCVERECEFANKKTKKLYKVSNPSLDDFNFKKEELEPVGDLSDVCSQPVLKCLYLVRIGRPDHGKQTNMLDQSLSGQEHVTDHWHAWSWTFITQNDYRQNFHVGTSAQQCR